MSKSEGAEATAKIMGRTAFSSHPISLIILTGSRVKERFRLTAEQAALKEIGPYELEDTVRVIFEGDGCRIVAREPELTAAPSP